VLIRDRVFTFQLARHTFSGMHKIVGPTLSSQAGIRNENMGAYHPEWLP
jgi:hypothetical protein